MRSLRTSLVFMAVVNLLAVAGFVGWLGSSGRLTLDRVEQVRELFRLPADEAEAEAAAAADEAAAAAQADADARRLEDPPLPAGARLARNQLEEDATAQAMRRIQLEARERDAELDARARRLDTDRATFEAEQAAWRASIQQSEQRRADEQFAQAVSLYAALKPKAAKDHFVELAARGETEQVVAYLDAMNTRTASKILGEFRTPDEQRLATDLLERLRVLGRPIPVDGTDPESDADDDDAARESGP